MLDIKRIRDNPEAIKLSGQHKNFPVDVDRLLDLDQQIRAQQQELETLQAERNSLSKSMGKASAEEREAIRSRVVEIKEQLDNRSDSLRSLRAEFDDLMLHVPQPAAEDVPVGKDDQENVEIRKWGEVKHFDFEPKDHVTLGEQLGIIDIPRGVKLAGSRSYLLCGQGALLERALLEYTIDFVMSKGYQLMSVPVLVGHEAMEGTGYFPIGRDQAYLVEKDDLALVGTSEVALCAMHQGDVFDAGELPKKYLARTSCFRREAGTYGKDTKGLYRVHQFQKVEMVVIGPADVEFSKKIHQELLTTAEELFQSLELPYRVVYVCTGDLGLGQVRKHDIETWMPSRGGYCETHSCSTFYDFQSRRLQIKYKDSEGKRVFAHTLNNTALAAPRAIIAILENHQTADGRIRVPEPLRKYMSGLGYIG